MKSTKWALGAMILFSAVLFQNCGWDGGIIPASKSSPSSSPQGYSDMGGTPYEGDNFAPNRIASCVGDSTSPIQSIDIHFTDRYVLVFEFNDQLLSPPSPQRTIPYASLTNVTVNGSASQNFVILNFNWSEARDYIDLNTILNQTPTALRLSCGP